MDLFWHGLARYKKAAGKTMMKKLIEVTYTIEPVGDEFDGLDGLNALSEILIDKNLSESLHVVAISIKRVDA